MSSFTLLPCGNQNEEYCYDPETDKLGARDSWSSYNPDYTQC